MICHDFFSGPNQLQLPIGLTYDKMIISTDDSTKLLNMSIFSEFIGDLPIQIMIFHSYVELPEGRPYFSICVRTAKGPKLLMGQS